MIIFPMLRLIIGQEGIGPYLHILTHFVSFDIPEWLLLEQVDDCEQLSTFWGQRKMEYFHQEKRLFGLRR